MTNIPVKTKRHCKGRSTVEAIQVIVGEAAGVLPHRVTDIQLPGYLRDCENPRSNEAPKTHPDLCESACNWWQINDDLPQIRKGGDRGRTTAMRQAIAAFNASISWASLLRPANACH